MKNKRRYFINNRRSDDLIKEKLIVESKKQYPINAVDLLTIQIVACVSPSWTVLTKSHQDIL